MFENIDGCSSTREQADLQPTSRFIGIQFIPRVVEKTSRYVHSPFPSQHVCIHDHCRAETVRSALDVLAVCSVMPRVQLLLCDRVDLPDEAMTVGMNIILGAAEGEIVADADVQRAALAVIINCVCAPIHRVGGSVGRFSISGSSKKKTNNFRSSEELIGKMWESVRSNNGIMVRSYSIYVAVS